jgi:sugar/nucleoside kinase (ribokinase family)
VTVDQILSVRKFPRDNTTEDVIDKTTTLGGTGTNIAVVAATLGCPTALCAFVGNDFPAQYERQMADSGLIMDEFVHVDRYETSTCVIVNDPSLTQKVVFFQGPQGFADDLGIVLDSNACKSEHVHFCTGQPSYYTMLMGRIKGKARIALDPAQESHRIWTPENFPPALALSDALFCNNFEAESLSRYIGVDDIMDADVGMVVCTHGAQGSKARIGDETIDIPLVKADKVVDATGAGDSYRGAYYTALYKGYDIPEALVIASSVASFVVERTGALTNIPEWDAAVERAEPYLRQIS